MANGSYSLSGYGAMISDRIRMDAFAAALRAAIFPGAVVMDIGTGTGIMSVLAVQLGASKVYAIEPDPVIQIAREIAVANQCSEKIEFLEDISTNVTDRIQADVIVSDMRGVLPLFGSHIPSVVDARRRFLAPGGKLIARRDRIWAAAVEAPEVYGKLVDPWSPDRLGQNMLAARPKVLNEFRRIRVKPEELVTTPKLWATLDYTSIVSPDIRGLLEWRAERDGTAHGFLVWFDVELADGVNFSTGPESPETVYGAAFFPWQEPVRLIAGQSVSVELEAKLLDADYFWRWKTRIAPPENAGGSAVSFEQSHLQAAILSPSKLHKSASDYVPQLSAEALLHRRALELMDGQMALEGIARQLASEFPQRFTHWHKALSYAGAISQDFSR